MDEWDWAFFYNEEQNNVESVTTFHQLDCDMGSLAEAHPEIIYFYATFAPLKEWDFNEYALAPADPDHPPLFEMGVDHATLFIGGREIKSEDLEIRSLSLDHEPNAFGGTLHIVQGGDHSELHRTDLWERMNDAYRAEPGTSQGE